jgi:class 3 adenylate cyclase
MKIKEFIKELKEKSEKRFDDFKIEDLESIKDITEEAYLEKPTWVGGDKEFVCLYVDLNKSSKMSFKKHPQTMAKIYDYFTQNLVDVYNQFDAEYIDIKGDGAFAIFEGEKASFRAFYAAITFKELFDSEISNKFKFEDEGGQKKGLGCKIGIHKDKILVRKIGSRKKYNEVWAGRVVNNAAKLAEKYDILKSEDLIVNTDTPIIVSEKVFDDFEKNKEYGYYVCHNKDTGEDVLSQEKPVFQLQEDLTDNTFGNKFYYSFTEWCEYCADDYINKI